MEHIIGTINIDVPTVYDPRVQRREGTSVGRAHVIANEWNPLALGIVTLSVRANGDCVIIDGAHRLMAAREVGYSQPIPAQYYKGLVLAQEAAMFRLLNTFKQPSYISRFLTLVIEGNPDAINITEIMGSHGWAIEAGAAAGSVAAVTTVERIYYSGHGAKPVDRYPEILDSTMGLITASWGHDVEGVHGAILGGVGLLFARMGDAVDVTKLAAEMAKERPNVLIGHARALQSALGGTVPSALGRRLVGMHNSRRRTNLLPEWVWTR